MSKTARIPPDVERPGRVTMQTIADALHVSKSMVSRALRGTGKVDAGKRRRILALARQLGYRSDPRLSYLSELRWGNRTSAHIKIAYLCDRFTGSNAPKMSALHEYAEQLGYEVEKYELDRQPTTDLDRVLYHRGIQGVLLDLHAKQWLPRLDWSRYSAIVLGEEHPELRLHRVETDWSSAFALLNKDLRREKRQKVAVALYRFAGSGLTREIHRETLLLQDDLQNAGNVKCLFRYFEPGSPTFEKAFDRWLERIRPDAVVACAESASQAASAYLRRAPGARAYTLNARSMPQDRRRRGIDIQLGLRARLAIDLLRIELLRDRKGLPSNPIRHLVPVRWQT